MAVTSAVAVYQNNITVAAALAALSDFTGNNTAPTIADYSNAGVIGVSSSNLKAVNCALARLASSAFWCEDDPPRRGPLEGLGM